MDEPVFPEIEAADSDPLNDLLPETPELSDKSSPNEPMEDDFQGLPELPSRILQGALPPCLEIRFLRLKNRLNCRLQNRV